MKRLNWLVLAALYLWFLTGAFAQNSRGVLAPGDPALTEEMVKRLESVYEAILDVRLNASQGARFQTGLIHYWTSNNTDGISGSLSNLKYYGKPDELASLKNSSQNTIIESLRRDIDATGDDV